MRDVFQSRNCTQLGMLTVSTMRGIEPIVLKRPDADYLIAFQYFDTDNNGQITFDEFKEAFSRVIGSGSESIRESRRGVSRSVWA